MFASRSLVFGSLVATGVAIVVACSSDISTIDTPALPDAASKDSGGGKDTSPPRDSSTTDPDASDSSTINPDASDAAPSSVVYAHSPDTLFTYDVLTQTLAPVAKFGGLTNQAIDLAVDENGNGYLTTFDGFFSVDLTNAVCTLISKGNSYPNSLSFVPKGTLDPSAEALVGYSGSNYLRIDTTTGKITNVGSLSNGFASSGDVVSVKGGGTFLTVTGNGCGDCLLQVDPVTGNVIQNYGDVKHKSVYGIAYWGGVVYGFDGVGNVFSVISSGNGITVTDLEQDAGAIWYGAGSTTNAPVHAADGGGISIK